jgi:hypothetical protein
MHGNTPYAGRPDEEATADQRRALRRNLAAVAAEARALLTDDFVIGGEVVNDADGLRATLAVRPPAGSVVTANLGVDEADSDLATDIAAGAAFEVLSSSDDGPDYAA